MSVTLAADSPDGPDPASDLATPGSEGAGPEPGTEGSGSEIETVATPTPDRQIAWPALISVAALALLLVVPAALALGFKQLNRGPTQPRLTDAAEIDAPEPNDAAGDCTISEPLADGDDSDAVRCLETRLRDAGYLDTEPDRSFDGLTAAAVRQFQEDNGLVVDGIVGPETGNELGTWAGPDALPPDASTCPAAGHAAVIDRFNQRAWLCDDGEISKVMPMTSAASQPDPGAYEVFEKDMNSSSDLTGKRSTMTHFVAFTTGRYTGARVAFHSVPKYEDGSFVQPLSSVGSPRLYGESSGCIRVLPDDAALIWDWLAIGDPVVVVS